MFFDKILDFFKIENLYGNNKDNGSDATLHIYDLIREAQDLATVINTTTDETTFYGSYEVLISILYELEKYEDIVPFVNKPSDDLKNVLANKEKAIEKFIMRSNQNVNNKPEKSIFKSKEKIAPTPTPTDCTANASIVLEENINSTIKNNSSPLPYKCRRAAGTHRKESLPQRYCRSTHKSVFYSTGKGRSRRFRCEALG